MPQEIIKNTVKDKIYEEVNKIFEKRKNEDKSGTQVFIQPNLFDSDLGLDVPTLGKILEELRKDGFIVSDIVYKFKTYIFKVKFLGLVLDKDKPRFFYDGKSVKVSWNGITRIIGRSGNLKAELAYEIGQNWGIPRNRSYVINNLKERVSNKRTLSVVEEDHIKRIETQLKEINRTLKKNGMPTIKLVEIKDPSKPFHARWKFMLKIDKNEPDVVVIYDGPKKLTNIEKIKKALKSKLKS